MIAQMNRPRSRRAWVVLAACWSLPFIVSCLSGDEAFQNNAVRGCSTAGLLLVDAAAIVRDSVIGDIHDGAFYIYDQSPTPSAVYEGIADGIVVGSFNHPSSVTLASMRIAGASRACLLYRASGGLIASVETAGCRYGLVALSEPKPDWQDPTNEIVGDEQDALLDGDLPVPTPPPVPE